MSLPFLITTLIVVAWPRERCAVQTRPRALAWMRRSFAAASVALGVKLAVAER